LNLLAKSQILKNMKRRIKSNEARIKENGKTKRSGK
jgi:hypothetical protein